MNTPLNHNCKLTNSMIREVGKHHVDDKDLMLDFIFEFGYLTHDKFLPILERYLPHDKWLPEFFLCIEEYMIYKETTESLAKALTKANSAFNRNKRERVIGSS